LRFARDLHSLLELSLSGIVLRAELARRLVVRDPARAGAELAQILQICRRASLNLRSIVRQPRELPLEEEARSVKAILTAAGVEVRMDLDYAGLARSGENPAGDGAARGCHQHAVAQQGRAVRGRDGPGRWPRPDGRR
jgi:hypothetical protein